MLLMVVMYGGGAMTMAEAPPRLEEYLEGFLGAFRRRDQARWAGVYLRALLAASGRRTVENLARATADEIDVEDAAQALGHFLNHSPWDENRLWQRHAQRLAQRGNQGVFVLEELALPKQGRHSVGVHRQYSRALGRKVNCQLAVVLHHLGPAGHTPLWLRLYLPRAWLADYARLDATGVPEAARAAADRQRVALELLDAVSAAGLRTSAIVSGPGWPPSEELNAAVAARGMAYREEWPQEWAAAFQAGRGRLEELGLGHFEGRSWRGFHHHACLVMLAHGIAE
jgi:SRSO17 transposase